MSWNGWTRRYAAAPAWWVASQTETLPWCWSAPDFAMWPVPSGATRSTWTWSTWRLLLRMPPLLADFTLARPCKPFCEKFLTLPSLLPDPANHFAKNSWHYRIQRAIEPLGIVRTASQRRGKGRSTLRQYNFWSIAKERESYPQGTGYPLFPWMTKCPIFHF